MIKSLFLKAMRAICERGPSCQDELCDTVSVFAAGWTECAVANGVLVSAETQVELDTIADPNFAPDESWDWTK